MTHDLYIPAINMAHNISINYSNKTKTKNIAKRVKIISKAAK